ncbi:MAG: alpha-2-macroglobulin family protein [Rhodobacteraceae bacterium]|nr:alpha-2-macroglobulin family protein [Paracoccaceae bacterium]
MVRLLATSLFLLVLSVAGALAQSAVPQHRYVSTSDMDFYGADLDALFDTDLQSCIRACDANPSCSAFTFNTRSNACFPKKAVETETPYIGAISARKIDVPAAVRNAAAERVTDLTFVSEKELAAAGRLARSIGIDFPAGGLDLQAVLDLAAQRAGAGDYPGAARWNAFAVALSDRSDLWVEQARLWLSINNQSNARRRSDVEKARLAAINGYLRAGTGAERASAMVELAEALERAGRGRDMVAALRLAQASQPRLDIAEALDKAIAKYGFRVTGSTVESDEAQPRICVEFSEKLVQVGVDYATYVKLPEPDLVVDVQERNLCISGVQHGERYRLVLRSGLVAENGEQLYRDVELSHYIRDRAPSVRFPGRSYVLAKTGPATLPVETVNVSELDLILRRVSDRNLLTTIRQGYFGRPLSYWQEDVLEDELSEEVWRGTGVVSGELNRDVTTRLPMDDAIAGAPAGIYALTAKIPGSDPYDNPGATQWFVISDLGLSTMSGVDGLHVQVRGLGDAQPRAGVSVTLVNRANAELAVLTTGQDGYVRFDPGYTRGTGSSAPALLIAQEGEQDLAFLSLTDPAFDLSDRGVEGREPAGPVDVFLATDRGAYRAGETIHATALARDAEAKAIDGLPLTAILTRPDGVEYARHLSTNGKAGGHVFALGVGGTAPRGTWRIDIKSDPEGPALASQKLLVEDFLPERIDFDQTLTQTALKPGQRVGLSLNARYLFGAPGAGLKVEGQVSLKSVNKLDGWSGYTFGRHDDRAEIQSGYFGTVETDRDGTANFDIGIPATRSSGRPLSVSVITRVADGGARPVERVLTAAVQPGGPIIGIRKMFGEDVPNNSEAGFQIVALNEHLQAMPMTAKWTLNRLETRYHWYQLYGSWHWESSTRRTAVASGDLMLGADPAQISAPVEWGRYELVVERTGGAYVAASSDFYAGWYVPENAADTPDRLEMSLDRQSYGPGDTAKLRVVSRVAGTAMVSVMSNHLIERKAVAVSAGVTEIPLTVSEEWGSGAYVSATVLQPAMRTDAQTPIRALGIAHAAVDRPDRALDVAIAVPDIARPRGEQTVSLIVAGAAEGDQAWVTLAAVDLGILNLTGFQSPDPSDHYFGQRRLGMELRDLYGRLIDPSLGALGQVRSGGDQDNGLRMQSPPPTQDLMAVFNGPVQVGPGGRVDVTIPLPDFNGTVRLMAVAWSGTAVGQAEADMIVRDPVVVTASLPRFLAPGDQSRILLEITHADGPAGTMGMSLSGSPELALAPVPSNVMLSASEKVVLQVPVSSDVVGDHDLQLALTTPDGKVLTQKLRLAARANDPVVGVTRRFQLAGGDTFLLSRDVFAGLRAGTGRAVVSAGPLAKFDVPGLLTALDQYPYGCTEQVTSKALPLLYLSSVAKAAGLGDRPQVENRIAQSIDTVLSRQAPNGAFGLWRAESGDLWLDAYASDFLSRARLAGHAVPDQAFRQAMDNLRNQVNYASDFDRGGQAIAYALMVLAREGAAAMGDLRYYADVKGDAFSTPLAAAQLGAALASYGDQTRADRMFARASSMIRGLPAEQAYWRVDYGTRLRDRAGLLALAAASGSTAVDQQSLVASISRPASELSTQEAAWSLLAAHALVQNAEASGMLVNGAPVEGPFVQFRNDRDLQDPLRIEAATGRTTDITLTTLGVPEVAPDAGGNGYHILRRHFSLDGDPLDISTLRVGQRFVTVLFVDAFEGLGGRLMINDPLAAGVEIDNPNLLRSGDLKELDWLDLSPVQSAEFRSDRFLAAVNLRKGNRVQLAYIARAVTPGEFHHPAASVEDMYRPRYRARGETGRITIQP